MGKFNLKSKFKPAGDQPEAIKRLVDNFNVGTKHQTLWGVTGSGKTFTMANMIEKVQKPTLVIAHNKTLAAQLADEFRQFFPDNAVHYFVSYYDYYQPEAYIPYSDTYIEKDSSINEEIERLRHATTHALLTRKDVIVVASVSCIYGIGSPEFYRMDNFIFKVGEKINRKEFLYKLNNLQYQRNDVELKRGTYRLRGDILELMPAYAENSIKVEFFGDMVEKIYELDWVTAMPLRQLEELEVFPATLFMTPVDVQKRAVQEIRRDMEIEVAVFKKRGKPLEAERLGQRTNFDLEMIEETGSCSGIENYSRYFDNRKIGEAPTTLIDYFPKDFLLFVDESHITIPQIGGMYFGDKSRKEKLIDYGFRLKAAFDNRPLKFPEFYKKLTQMVFVSATPKDFEMKKSQEENIVNGKNKKYDAVIRQFVRPTGLLDPVIEVIPTKGQINHLMEEITKTIDRGERVLITTLTKRMAEELTEYLKEKGVKVAYLHSDIPTLERLDILTKLRLGKFDVLVGINLLREGLDLPEVSLVAILDADKEGFLRSKTSLVQTMGRAARHSQGRVLMFADSITDSMKGAIAETDQRRKVQEEYNRKNNITPITIHKSAPIEEIEEEEKINQIDMLYSKLSKKEKSNVIKEMRQIMMEAARNLQFEKAVELRDRILALEGKIK